MSLELPTAWSAAWRTNAVPWTDLRSRRLASILIPVESRQPAFRAAEIELHQCSQLPISNAEQNRNKMAAIAVDNKKLSYR